MRGKRSNRLKLERHRGSREKQNSQDQPSLAHIRANPVAVAHPITIYRVRTRRRISLCQPNKGRVGGAGEHRPLVGVILLEQYGEWAVQRARYMILETIAPLSDDPVVGLPAVTNLVPVYPAVVITKTRLLRYLAVRSNQAFPTRGRRRHAGC